MAPSAAADKVFANPLGQINDFVFDERVAAVFDDMVSRSVGNHAGLRFTAGRLAN
jgi:tRNA (cmo5U34)-methyltransferase